MIYSDEKKIFAFVNLLLLLALTAACSNVEIVSRSEWGARPAAATWTIVRPVRHVIIGHTVTAECLSKESCANIMRSMQNHHMKLGWGDIGYNFVIGGDGRVYEGVGWTREGIHTYGWNKKSYGIAFIGNFMKAKPNEKMLKAARSLIVCGVQKEFISHSREIHGARDATCTLSPGDALYEIIKQWPMFKGGPLDGYKCS
ncbi:peptidoglycan-recognition protein 1 [Caerostris darwini]|uniref:Peptidoglycan-recognition protein n=1 Tax=Caerostris darwini TaxID=1538125 RepID=A0AAV4RMJ4_9ARAC|nr:peptidoglycan-recognition protein 1 [Caerostris darwini]